MTRHGERQRVRLDELVDELAIAAAQRLRCTSDEVEPVVRAVVAYLSAEYATQDFYIPATPRELPLSEIQQAIARGESLRSICRRYRTDRRTIYRALG